MEIRNVNPQDSKQIADIYNFYIKSSTITFEEDIVDENKMEKIIFSISSVYPYLVIEEKDKILGYAYATAWRARSAYRFSAEVTIYLNNEAKGKGLGSVLFSELINELKKTKVNVLVGGIALPNNASIALHEKFGFKKVAHFEDIGFKFGKWIDVGYWELKLK